MHHVCSDGRTDGHSTVVDPDSARRCAVEVQVCYKLGRRSCFGTVGDQMTHFYLSLRMASDCNLDFDRLYLQKYEQLYKLF